MNRRTFLATTASTATAATAGCPTAPGTGGSTATATPTAGVETASGREAVRAAHHEFSRPFGVDAVDAREDVAAMSRDERVAANRRWVRDHVAAYDQGSDRYQAFLEPVLGPGRGLRNWYSGADPPEMAPWMRAVTDALGESAWVDRQAWLGTFDPGSDAFRYVFGGRRTYDVATHTITFAGNEFRGIDPDNYLYSFGPDDATRAEMASTLLRTSQRVWEQVYEFFRTFLEGNVTHAKAGSFNGAVALVGGPTVIDAGTCEGCGDEAALRAAMNHQNRFALMMEEFGFPPRPLDA